MALHLHQQSTWRLAAESEDPVARGDCFGIIYLASRRRKQPLFIRSDPRMLNLEILRISLILQAPGRSGPPLRNCPTSPRPSVSGPTAQRDREGLGRGGSGQPGPRQQELNASLASQEGAPRPAGSFIFKCLCTHVYNTAPSGQAQPDLWQNLRAPVHGSGLGTRGRPVQRQPESIRSLSSPGWHDSREGMQYNKEHSRFISVLEDVCEGGNNTISGKDKGDGAVMVHLQSSQLSPSMPRSPTPSPRPLPA